MEHDRISPVHRGVDEKGFKDSKAFIRDLRGAIDDEANAIEFYNQLISVTPQELKDYVAHARDDERVHLRMFQKLYRRLTGRQAVGRVTKTQFSSLKDGFEMAFQRELEAAELYRNMYLSTSVPKIRDVLFRAMTDEMEHAQRFSFVYARV